ncbi:hypothetical protein ACP70R_023236 [Stipagrostis hirtigluma subsp. patula]
MELQFQKPQSHPQQQCHYQVPVAKETKPRGRSKCCSSSGSSKFVGVRQRPSGRWVAEIKDTTQKIRMWLGTFETAEEAARAYDEAACLLRGANTRTNFAAAPHASPPDSPVTARIRALLHHKKLKKNASQPAFFCSTAYGGIITTTAAASSNTSTITTTTGSVSPRSSASSTINFAMSSCGISTPDLPAQSITKEVYTPYLLNGGEEFQLGPHQFDRSWPLNTSLPQTDMGGCGTANGNASSGIADLGMIKQEKESSASPHGMDRAEDQDCFDMGNDASDSLWDLPPICPLSCRTLMY